MWWGQNAMNHVVLIIRFYFHILGLELQLKFGISYCIPNFLFYIFLLLSSLAFITEIVFTIKKLPLCLHF